MVFLPKGNAGDDPFRSPILKNGRAAAGQPLRFFVLFLLFQRILVILVFLPPADTRERKGSSPSFIFTIQSLFSKAPSGVPAFPSTAAAFPPAEKKKKDRLSANVILI